MSLHYITLHFAMLYITLGYSTLCYIMLHSVTLWLCYATVRYFLLCYIFETFSPHLWLSIQFKELAVSVPGF